jgi:hypothetical protein
VWKYDFAPEYSRRFNIDIFARSASAEDYSIIGEVKSREVKKFTKDEAVEFEGKFSEEISFGYCNLEFVCNL